MYKVSKEYEEQLLQQAKENIKKMLSKHVAFGEEQNIELELCKLLIAEVDKFRFVKTNEKD